MKRSVILITVVFGLAVAGALYLLAYALLDLGAYRSLLVAGALGFLQAGGGLFYIHRRFKYQGTPPRNGGLPG